MHITSACQGPGAHHILRKNLGGKACICSSDICGVGTDLSVLLVGDIEVLELPLESVGLYLMLPAAFSGGEMTTHGKTQRAGQVFCDGKSLWKNCDNPF